LAATSSKAKLARILSKTLQASLAFWDAHVFSMNARVASWMCVNVRLNTLAQSHLHDSQPGPQTHGVLVRSHTYRKTKLIFNEQKYLYYKSKTEKTRKY
jgi:hypothetical protein